MNGPSPADPAPGERARSATRRGLWAGLRVAVGLGALAWTLSRVSLEDLVASAARIGPGPALAAVGATFLALVVATERWRLVLAAYAAPHLPRRRDLLRLYLVGLFYNTYLPGAVGGELVRGWATRHAFGAQGAGGGLAVVVVERLFGLAGLLTLGAGVLAVHPVTGTRHLPALAAAGLAAALAAASSPLLLRRLAPWVPGRFRGLVAGLPTVRRPALLGVVLLLSVGTQALSAITGWVLLRAIDPGVALMDALVLVPLAMVAAFFPFTQAGLGVREAAFVWLFTRVGVARADATAASLGVLAAQLVVAGVGGLLSAEPPAPRPRARRPGPGQGSGQTQMEPSSGKSGSSHRIRVGQVPSGSHTRA